MGVYRKRRCDAEIIVGLHDLGGPASGIQCGNDLRPAGSGVYLVGLLRAVEFDCAIVKGDRGALFRNRLPAHGVTRSADVERPPL